MEDREDSMQTSHEAVIEIFHQSTFYVLLEN